MPQPGESGWAPTYPNISRWRRTTFSDITTERVLPDCDERGTVSDLFDSDLAHLFDYCRALLGQDAEAIRTARSVLDSPHDPLADRERLRAWHFGLTRSLALALRPPGSDGPSYRPRALIATSNQQAQGGVLRPFHAITDRDREILDLVYRHRVRPADLPAVLIAPAEETYRRLVNAEAEFVSLATGPNNGPGADLEDIAALPLAALPRAALPLSAVPLPAVPLPALPAAEQGERQPEDPPAYQVEEP